MIIKSNYINTSGQKVEQEYYDEEDLVGKLDPKDFGGIHAFCFYNDKLILVNHPKKGWAPVGGGMEKGETYEETTEREVKEETNMKVLHQELIGYSIFKIEDGRIVKQTRSMCIVEPYGEFVSDPDGEIMEIKFIEPSEYKENFDWGETGERIMQKALELKKKYLS